MSNRRFYNRLFQRNYDPLSLYIFIGIEQQSGKNCFLISVAKARKTGLRVWQMIITESLSNRNQTHMYVTYMFVTSCFISRCKQLQLILADKEEDLRGMKTRYNG